MARWVRFESEDGIPVLVNIDNACIDTQPAEEGDNPRLELHVDGYVVKGDIDSLALMLGAETYP